jgi:phosphatidylglycerophosphatase A
VMPERWIRVLATGFGVGLVPVGAGLAGSVVGVVYWVLLVRTQSGLVYWGVWMVSLVVAVWVAGEAARAMRKPDPPSVVVDEIVAVPVALAGLGAELWEVVVAFVLFRVFDVVKPPPIRQAQAFTGGIGIVLDDLVAAGYACALTHLAGWVVGRLGG